MNIHEASHFLMDGIALDLAQIEARLEQARSDDAILAGLSDNEGPVANDDCQPHRRFFNRLVDCTGAISACPQSPERDATHTRILALVDAIADRGNWSSLDRAVYGHLVFNTL